MVSFAPVGLGTLAASEVFPNVPVDVAVPPLRQSGGKFSAATAPHDELSFILRRKSYANETQALREKAKDALDEVESLGRDLVPDRVLDNWLAFQRHSLNFVVWDNKAALAAPYPHFDVLLNEMIDTMLVNGVEHHQDAFVRDVFMRAKQLSQQNFVSYEEAVLFVIDYAVVIDWQSVPTYKKSFWEAMYKRLLVARERLFVRDQLRHEVQKLFLSHAAHFFLHLELGNQAMPCEFFVESEPLPIAALQAPSKSIPSDSIGYRYTPFMCLSHDVAHAGSYRVKKGEQIADILHLNSNVSCDLPLTLGARLLIYKDVISQINMLSGIKRNGYAYPLDVKSLFRQMHEGWSGLTEAVASLSK